MAVAMYKGTIRDMMELERLFIKESRIILL